MKILLITGGNSSERVVSLTSAKNVQKALTENGHKITFYDLRNGYNTILKIFKEIDIIFPVLHGEEGEGGKLHKFLSKINKPIVGTRNYKGLENAWYKIPFKNFCDKNAILTPKWKIVGSKNDITKFGFPCVLKASNGGSSREVVILKSENDLKSKTAQEILKSNAPLFVEEYLKGTEVTVGILNGKVLPLVEIIPPKNQWFSYENKYASSTKEIPFAPSVSKQLQEKIKKTLVKIHDKFDLGSYSRTDFIIVNNKAFTLDVNTIPGLTPNSLLPKEALAAGISFNKMIEILISSAK